MRSLKTKISRFVVLAFLLLVSCQPAAGELETDIINDILPELLEEYSDIAPLKYESGARVLLIADSLVTPTQNYQLSILTKGRDFAQYLKMDSTWNELIFAFTQPDASTIPLNIKKLQPVKDYKPESSSLHNSYNKHDIVGVAAFSRIVFDKDKSRACLYYSFLCSSECGEGHMVFLERVNDHWTIVHARHLWVA